MYQLAFFCCFQGMADTFILLGMAFDSPEAAQLNKEIFETIYFAALETSCSLAEQEGTQPPACSLHLQKPPRCRFQTLPAALQRTGTSSWLLLPLLSRKLCRAEGISPRNRTPPMM